MVSRCGMVLCCSVLVYGTGVMLCETGCGWQVTPLHACEFLLIRVLLAHSLVMNE